MNIVLQIYKWRKYCGRFTDIIALKPMILTAISHQSKGGETGLRVKPPGKFLESHFFHIRDMPFLVYRGHYKKGTFPSLL